MENLKKNLLDLQHNLYSIKGASLLGFGVIGAFSFFSVAMEFISERLIVLLISIIWFGLFGILAIKQFSECNKIQRIIKESIAS